MKIFFVPRDFQTADLRLDPEYLWHEQQAAGIPTNRLADLVEVVTSIWAPEEIATTDSVAYIDISSIDVETGRISGTKSITSDDAPARAKRIVYAGDVLVSTVRPDRGAVAIVPESLDGAVASTAFVVLRPTRTSSAVIWAWLRSLETRQRLAADAGGSTFSTLRQSQLLQLPVPAHMPDTFSELAQQVQQIINRTVSATDPEGDGLQAPSLMMEYGLPVDEKKEKVFWVERSVLSVDRLDPESYIPQHADLFRRLQDAGHAVVPLGEVASLVAGAPTRSGDDGGTPIIRPRNLREGRLDLSDLAQVEPMRASVPVQAGDILVTVMGARCGEAALVSKEAEGLLFDNNLALVRLGDFNRPHVVDTGYLIAYLNSDLAQALIAREASSLGAIQRLSVAGLKELPVILPSLAEQRRVANKFRPEEIGPNRDDDTARLLELSEAIARLLSQVQQH